jgi:hypothetical protein
MRPTGYGTPSHCTGTKRVRVSASTIYAAAVHSPRAKGTCLQDVNEQVGRGFLPVGKSVVGLWPMQGVISLTWLYYRG